VSDYSYSYCNQKEFEQDYLSIESGPPQNVFLVMPLYDVFHCDLDLDPVILTYEQKLDILETYLDTKTEVSRSRLSKVGARTGQTDAQRRDRTHYHGAFAAGINQLILQ